MSSPSRRVGRLHLPAASLELHRREHGVVAGVVHEHHRRAVGDLAALAQRELVGDREHFVVRDQQALVAAHRGRPAAREGAAAGARQVQRARALAVLARVARQVLFVRADGQFHRLHQLADEAVDGPGVDELVVALGLVAGLRVALGDLDHRDFQFLRQVRPVLVAGRLSLAIAQVLVQFQQRALHEVRDQPRVGAVIDHRGGCVGAELLGQLQRLLADHEVGALAHVDHGVVVHAGPGLDGGVHVQRAARGAEADHVQARHIHRQVQHQVAGAHMAAEQARVIGRVSGARAGIRRRTWRARLRPASSAASTSRRSLPSSVTWRLSSGSMPWPMLPQPSMMMRPENSTGRTVDACWHAARV